MTIASVITGTQPGHLGLYYAMSALHTKDETDDVTYEYLAENYDYQGDDPTGVLLLASALEESGTPAWSEITNGGLGGDTNCIEMNDNTQADVYGPETLFPGWRVPFAFLVFLQFPTEDWPTGADDIRWTWYDEPAPKIDLTLSLRIEATQSNHLRFYYSGSGETEEVQDTIPFETRMGDTNWHMLSVRKCGGADISVALDTVEIFSGSWTEGSIGTSNSLRKAVGDAYADDLAEVASSPGVPWLSEFSFKSDVTFRVQHMAWWQAALTDAELLAIYTESGL